MQLITKIVEIEMSHRLPDHSGKCKNIHGHTYKIEVTVAGIPGINGMIIDFGDLKRVMSSLLDTWDHCLMLYKGDALVKELIHVDIGKLIVLPFIPTAENMSFYIANHIQQRIDQEVVEVKIWETSNSFATWRK